MRSTPAEKYAMQAERNGPGRAAEEGGLLPGEPLHAEQHRRQEQPVEIDEADDSPGEIAPRKRG